MVAIGFVGPKGLDWTGLVSVRIAGPDLGSRLVFFARLLGNFW